MRYTGVAEGINQDGELMVVRDDTGEKVSVYGGLKYLSGDFMDMYDEQR